VNPDPTNLDRKNTDLANINPREAEHERARLMVVLLSPASAGPEEFSQAEQSWLAAHLESCQSCRAFAENAREAVRSLRATPVTATGHLVSVTQMRVHQRAAELQHQRERFWVVCACCAAVTFCSAATTAVASLGLAWMGQQARLASPLWEGAFIVLYFMPAVGAGLVLLARGTHMPDHSRSFQG
jgi:hypothetical protein